MRRELCSRIGTHCPELIYDVKCKGKAAGVGKRERERERERGRVRESLPKSAVISGTELKLKRSTLCT